MRHLILLVSLLFCAALAYGQDASRIGYYMIPQAGLLNGDRSVSAQVTINGGIEYKGWGIGIASGIDYYKIRSVPLLLDIRRDIEIAKRPFLVYVNAGFNIPAPLGNQYRIMTNWWSGWNQTENRYKPGLYGEAGIGYKFLNKAKKGFILSLGFTGKSTGEYYTETLYSPTPPNTITQYERKLNYTFNRIVMKIGYRL